MVSKPLPLYTDSKDTVRNCSKYYPWGQQRVIQEPFIRKSSSTPYMCYKSFWKEYYQLRAF